ncbi:MAG TPA: hypothetical protein PKA19_01375 [Bacillota bacterium]|nr:hypothetical protein [Bacillota bacterium]
MQRKTAASRKLFPHSKSGTDGLTFDEVTEAVSYVEMAEITQDVSIALGFATKVRSEESIVELLKDNVS